MGTIEDSRSSGEGWTEEGQKKKEQYLQRFALKYKDILKQLDLGGVFGKGNREWRNVWKHCLMVAITGDVLAEGLGANRDLVVRAGFLHDWGKRIEKELMTQYGWKEGLAISDNVDREALRQGGFSDEVIHLAHANVLKQGSTEYLQRRSIEEKIMHYVDHIVNEVELMDWLERKLIAKARMPEFLNACPPEFEGRRRWDVDVEACTLEQAEFEERIGIPSGYLLNFIKKKLDERFK